VSIINHDNDNAGHNGMINSFDFSANILVSGSSDAAIKVWNINTGRCYSTLLGHTDEVSKVIILNDYLVRSIIFLFLFCS
jgi:WD40 repeat protein